MKEIFIVKNGDRHFEPEHLDEIGDYIKVQEWLRDGSLKEGDIIYKCMPVFKVELGELQLKSLNDQYNIKEPFRYRVKALLVKLNKFSHIQELAELARNYGEPEIGNVDKRNLIERISSNLTALKNKPENNIVKIKIGTAQNSYLWGFKNWLNENGEIKFEYKN